MKKNEHKKGSQLKLSSNEMKGLKKYKENYVEDVKEMHDAIKETVPYYALEVYKEFVKMVSEYHTKYIQILGGTSFVKELVPVKKVINEASKYSVDFEWGVCFVFAEIISDCVIHSQSDSIMIWVVHSQRIRVMNCIILKVKPLTPPLRT